MTSPDTTLDTAQDPPQFQLGGDLTYQQATGMRGARYDVDEDRAFAGDQVAYATLADLPDLAASPHWEDRVRAEVLRERTKIVLPDQFPCIYETADSPTKADHKYPAPSAWVVSPDVDMLTRLLPIYQEAWDAYTSQWGPQSRRTFAVGALDGLSPRSVYLPGTTIEQVMAQTMYTHTGIYQRAPEHIKAMHPQHAGWMADRAARIAAMAG